MLLQAKHWSLQVFYWEVTLPRACLGRALASTWASGSLLATVYLCSLWELLCGPAEEELHSSPGAPKRPARFWGSELSSVRASQSDTYEYFPSGLMKLITFCIRLLHPDSFLCNTPPPSDWDRKSWEPPFLPGSEKSCWPLRPSWTQNLAIVTSQKPCSPLTICTCRSSHMPAFHLPHKPKVTLKVKISL